MKKIIFLFLGILYYLAIQINIIDMQSQSRKTSFSIDTYMPQYVKLHIQAKRNQLQLVRCNTKEFIFPIRDRLWFERTTQEVYVHLKRGQNYCEIVPQKNVKFYSGKIKRKYTFMNYIILFILLGLPLFSWFFSFFIARLDKFRLKYIKNNKEKETVFCAKDISLTSLMWAILILGMTIRILYFQKFGISHFQHDVAGHIEFIKYMAEQWSLPLGEKGLQFPQQPLYYAISGGIYSALMKFGMSDRESLYNLGYFSLLCSFVFLYYGAKLFLVMTEDRFVQYVAMLSIAATPSLVYMAARINNDVLVMALSAYSIYFSVKSYQMQFVKYFYRALLGVSLLFMTKVSSAPIELLLFFLLSVSYIYKRHNTEGIREKLFLFVNIGLFVLGLTLLKAYLPIENIFHMVNSSSAFPGQIIKTLNIEYFCSFNFPSLIEKGYSYVFGEDSIRYSLLTYQYGTMFFGEFNYSNYVQTHKDMKWIMQAILILGLVYVMGLLAYIVYLVRVSILEKIFFIIVLINFLLIIKFMTSYTVVCNTDYRYFVASFGLLAFIYAQGLKYLQFNKYLTYIISGIISVLTIFEVIFYILLLG